MSTLAADSIMQEVVIDPTSTTKAGPSTVPREPYAVIVGTSISTPVPTSISQQQVDDMRGAFEMFDLDKDGRITGDELKTVMKKLRIDVSDEEVQTMIQRVDIDGNGTIEFEEFVQMMCTRLLKHEEVPEEERKRLMEKEVQQAFTIFDIDGDGLLDADEILNTMNNLGMMVTEEDIAAMIKNADTNGDGKIDYQEFITVMSRHSNSNHVG